MGRLIPNGLCATFEGRWTQNPRFGAFPPTQAVSVKLEMLHQWPSHLPSLTEITGYHEIA